MHGCVRISLCLCFLMTLVVPTLGFAQTVQPLSPASKYACLKAGATNKVIIPTSNGFRLSSFPKAQADIEGQLKTTVGRRKQVRDIKIELKRRNKVSVDDIKALRKQAKFFGVNLPEVINLKDGQSEDEIAIDNLLILIDAQITNRRAELKALDNCKRNRTVFTTNATKIPVYTVLKTGTGNRTSYTVEFFAMYRFFDVTNSPSSATVCTKLYAGSLAGTWASRNFVQDPCKGFRDLKAAKGDDFNYYGCDRGFDAMQRAILNPVYGWQNFPDPAPLIELGSAKVLEVPDSIEVRSVPNSANGCSEYNGK